jgi:2,3-bisphosphoglycerate-dependent phosphoglycerate mutase
LNSPIVWHVLWRVPGQSRSGRNDIDRTAPWSEAALSYTYVLRHASTSYSREFRVNGEPRVGVALDAGGRADCRAMGAELDWLGSIRTCVVSEFARTSETAGLILPDPPGRWLADPGLNEVDYGRFEGVSWQVYGAWLVSHGRWAVPAGARESLYDAQVRALTAVLAALALPGPRLVVTHGFLVSLLLQLRDHADVGDVVLPGCQPLTLLSFSDDDASSLLTLGLRDLAERATCEQAGNDSGHLGRGEQRLGHGVHLDDRPRKR